MLLARLSADLDVFPYHSQLFPSLNHEERERFTNSFLKCMKSEDILTSEERSQDDSIEYRFLCCSLGILTSNLNQVSNGEGLSKVMGGEEKHP